MYVSLLKPIGLFSHSFPIQPLMVMSKVYCEELSELCENQAEESGQLFSLSLFLIFLSWSLIDISPPAQGVDHRHVQKELGEVIVRLHNPVVISPTTIQVTWTVSAVSLFAYRIQLCLTNATHSASTSFFTLEELRYVKLVDLYVVLLSLSILFMSLIL